MKIGLSLSRCVREIVEGSVRIGDVLVIIARTKFDATDPAHWTSIWTGYTDRSGWGNPEWLGLEETATHQVVLNLWHQGKIHQPRQFGAFAVRRPEVWLEAVLPSEELEKHPAAQAAWAQFQTIAGLTDVRLRDDVN